MRSVIAVFALVALAGCLHSGGGGPVTTTTVPATTTAAPPTPSPFFVDCLPGGLVCVADPQSRDYRYALDQHGLHQIAEGGGGGTNVQISGDLITYACTGNIQGCSGSIVGYSISRHQLIPIAVEDHYYHFRPERSGDRLVFGREPGPRAPNAGEAPYMMYWDLESRNATQIEVPLGGEKVPQDFFYPTVLFHVRGSPNETEQGLWAFNLETHQLAQLFQSPPRNDFSVTLGDEAIEADRAYYSLRYDANDTSVLYEFNLTTQERRAVFAQPGVVLGRVEAEWPWLLTLRNTQGNPFLTAYNVRTHQTVPVSDPDRDYASWPSLGGGYAVYLSAESGGLVAVNLEANERRVVVEKEQDVFVTGDSGATDGVRFAYEQSRLTGRIFETTQSAFYWGFIERQE